MQSFVLDADSRKDRMCLIGITGVLIATTLLVSAYAPADVPFIDDWTYAWSVQHYLQTGKLRMLEWSAHYPLAQVVWGALFSQLLGFSFVVLRLSTLVLAWAGLVALFLTLRELGIPPYLSGLGTLVVWCNPLFFVLSHSFMTDVPFISAMNGALLGYVRWVKRRSTWDLWLGSGSATMAFLMRQLGLVLPLLPLAYLLLARIVSRERRGLPWSQWVCLLIPFVGIGLTLWWINAVHGETRVYAEKARNVYVLLAASDYLWEVLRMLLHLGLILSPLALGVCGFLPRRTLMSALGGLAVFAGLLIWYTGRVPYQLEGMLTWDELGLARMDIDGEMVRRHVPPWAHAAILGLSFSGAVGIVAALVDGLRRWRRVVQGPGLVLVVNGLLQVFFIEVLWLYDSRYYLPLLPGLTALLAARLRLTRPIVLLTLAGMLLSGFIALTGTIDEFRYLRAVADARAWLLQQGVAPAHIDAGYALNGWWLYAPTPQASSPHGGEPDVPWVTGAPSLPYKIANAAVPPYTVVRRIRWQPLWAVSDTLVVLEHPAVQETWGLPPLRMRTLRTQ
jgi:hypothetical protein